MPDLSGKTAVVTGSNVGLGFETAKALAGKGARVLLACRSLDKAEAARDRMLAEHPDAHIASHRLDLSNLDDVRRSAAALRDDLEHLDLLVNNAGVMTPPKSTTADGFELQFGTNHLGHFAFTGLVLELLERAEAPRVVTVSSIAHLNGRIDFDNFRLQKRYSSTREYAQSKLANLMFSLELERRLRAAARKTLSMGAHPGVSATELTRHFPRFLQRIAGRICMEPWQGALPSLYAATEPIPGGSYIGPDGLREAWGWPAPARIAGRAKDRDVARRLFDESESLTGVDFELPAASRGPLA